MSLPMSGQTRTKVIAIAAGKGGVGKSTVCVQLALALKDRGFSVGILDADLYGPSIRRMLGEGELPGQVGERLTPAYAKGISFISLAHFRSENQAAGVRAPIANSLITQFLDHVDWGPLDYLLIDFPPGTGDVQLTLSQKGNLFAAIMVATPQEVACMDVAKAIDLFRQVQVPIGGIVENMSGYCLPDSSVVYPFGKGGGQRLAKRKKLPFLGRIPIEPKLSSCADQGEMEKVEEVRHLFAALAFQVEQIKEAAQSFALKWLDEQTFTITWPSKEGCTIRIDRLQKACPCAGCKESGGASSEDVRVRRAHAVGSYALRFDFTKGCSAGIYDYALLASIGEAS